MAKETMTSLQDLLIHEMQDLYDAEHQIVTALPKVMKVTSNAELRTAFDEHLQQTHGHIKRLEQAFAALGEKAKRKTCKAMQGLIAETDETIKEDGTGSVMDAALIAAAQRVEHYEIAVYGTVRTMAYQLGYNEAAQLLQTTLDEEEQTDKKLTKISNAVNIAAMNVKEGQIS